MANLIQALAEGTRLQSNGRTYIVERVLGHGGFGITYLATTTVRLGQLEVEFKCAIKELFIKDICERAEGTLQVNIYRNAIDRALSARKDFMAEAKRLQIMSDKSQNIVKVNEVFEANNTAYYVMEYLQGQSLADYIKEKGLLSATEVRSLLGPIAEALRLMHANHMTHLDVKPGNIMLTKQKDGSVRPVLIDFGLAKHYDDDGNATSTINTSGFSDGYAPIEQYAGITMFSPASDVYALSATIFRALTGIRPAKANEVNLRDIRTALDAVKAPSDLRHLVTSAMSLTCADRPLLSDSVWNALKDTPSETDHPQFGEDEPTVYVSEPSDNTTNNIQTSPSRRWIWIVACIVVAISAFIALMLTMNPPEQSETTENDTISVTPIDTVTKLPADTIVDITQDTTDNTESNPKETYKPEQTENQVSNQTKETTSESDEKLGIESNEDLQPTPPIIAESLPGHLQPSNFELCATKDGKVRYFNQAEWNDLSDRNLWTRNGIYLSGNGLSFLIGLFDEKKSNGKSSYTGEEAIHQFRDILPTKKEGELIMDNSKALNAALSAFGGQRIGWRYWTRTEYNSTHIWVIDLYDQKFGAGNKIDGFYIRAVTIAPEASAK